MRTHIPGWRRLGERRTFRRVRPSGGGCVDGCFRDTGKGGNRRGNCTAGYIFGLLASRAPKPNLSNRGTTLLLLMLRRGTKTRVTAPPVSIRLGWPELRSGPIPEAHRGPRPPRRESESTAVTAGLSSCSCSCGAGAPASATRPLEGGGFMSKHRAASSSQSTVLPWAPLSCLPTTAQGSACSQRSWAKGHRSQFLWEMGLIHWRTAGPPGSMRCSGLASRDQVWVLGLRNLHLATMQGLWVPSDHTLDELTQNCRLHWADVKGVTLRAGGGRSFALISETVWRQAPLLSDDTPECC